VGISKLRIGLIGVGRISQGHISALSDRDEVQIVGIADPSEANVAKTVEQHAHLAVAKRFADYRCLLDQLKPDAVVICTPHTQHFAQTMDALDAGAHALIEKPMVCRVADAKVLLRRIESSGKVVGLSYQRHVSPQFRYVRDRIASGSVGNVQFITAVQQQNWKRRTIGTWRQDPAQSGGGQLNDSGSHLLDVILWATGLAPDTVSAFIDNRGTQVDINSALNVRFVGGAMGAFSIVGDAPEIVGDTSEFWEDITIWCDNGAFFVRNGSELEVQLNDGSFAPPPSSDMRQASNIDANFIHAIQGIEEIAAPPICGLRTIEVTEAAWESGAAGGALTAIVPGGANAQ